MSAAAPDALREPWHELELQRRAGAFGVWAFLASEALFFGGLILAYAYCRTLYPEAFAAGSRATELTLGSANTAILLTSSLTMALGAEAAAAGLRRLALWGLGLTIALGLAFLVVKGFEYRGDLEKHLWPGADFALPLPQSRLFFAFYWIMTGVHALHLTIGLGVITTLLVGGWRRTRALDSPVYEGVALYWHLVDVVWVFLWPLLYLVGRAGGTS